MKITTLFPFLLSTALASAQDSLNVRHLFHWDDQTIPASSQYGNQYNDVWGFAANGREYAFIGSTEGVHVFDVTAPENSVLIDVVPGSHTGTDIVHRDYKTYAGHLYAVCDEGPSSLQIINLQYLPDSVHLVYDSQELLFRAHNIQIDTLNARLYTNGGNTPFSVFSIADPASPVLIKDCEADIPWWGGTIGYVHDCFVRDNIVWCNDEDGMHVVDMTDIDEPVMLGSITTYPGQGYNHSGWMNDDGTLYVMADETHGSPLKFIDPADLSDLQVMSTATSGIDTLSIIHNPFFTGDRVHVAYYYDGYWLWDASDPLQPQLLGYYDTSPIPHSTSYEGAWGVYPFLPSGNILVSDMQTGLWVLQIDETTAVSDGSVSTPIAIISPTSTTGMITIRPMHPGSDRLSIEVIDASGRMIRAHTAANEISTEIDLRELQDGIYLITVRSGDRTHTQRIVKTTTR
ncbi:MAG: choice-of-anchor B family protein [Bacteroidota bacterium]|nr:choice-of-anchor B family protein [Bacteroidota bacterium]